LKKAIFSRTASAVEKLFSATFSAAQVRCCAWVRLDSRYEPTSKALACTPRCESKYMTASDWNNRAATSPCRRFPTSKCNLRISVIVDARFSLIVDGETASSRMRRGGAQALRLNVAQSSTISLKRCRSKDTSGLVLGLD